MQHEPQPGLTHLPEVSQHCRPPEHTVPAHLSQVKGVPDIAEMSLPVHGCPAGQSLAAAQSWSPAQGAGPHVAVTMLWPTSQRAQQAWPEAQLAALEHEREPPTVVQEPFAAQAPVHVPEMQQSCDAASQLREPHWMRPAAAEPSRPAEDASAPLALPPPVLAPLLEPDPLPEDVEPLPEPDPLPDDAEVASFVPASLLAPTLFELLPQPAQRSMAAASAPMARSERNGAGEGLIVSPPGRQGDAYRSNHNGWPSPIGAAPAEHVPCGIRLVHNLAGS
jgi:hypothetical protein